MPQGKQTDIIGGIASGLNRPANALQRAAWGALRSSYTDSEWETKNLPKYRQGNLPKGDSRLDKPIAAKINAGRHYQNQQGGGEYADDTNDTRDKRIDKYGEQAMSNMQSKQYGASALGGSNGSYANQGPISKMLGVRKDKPK